MKRYLDWAYKRSILNTDLTIQLLWIEIGMSLYIPVPGNLRNEFWNSISIVRETPGTLVISLFFLKAHVSFAKRWTAPIQITTYFALFSV